jgi:hypothetical protein
LGAATSSRTSRSRAEDLAGLDDFSGADAGSANADGFVSAIHDSPYAAQVGVPAALRDIVRVTDPVSVYGAFPADFARLSHADTSRGRE